MSDEDRTWDGGSQKDGVETVEPAARTFELAIGTDIGSERDNNEDAFGFVAEGATGAVFAVADGVGGYEGGEIASRMAIDITVETYRESPPGWAASKRLSRAAQRANMRIYDRAVVVTELSRMATTLTAAAVEGGILSVAHIGDCRLYLVRGGRLTQLTKDHTVAGGRARIGLLTKEQLRLHPERGSLTRSLGSELIAAIDTITKPIEQGDTILIASDGLYGVLTEPQLLELSLPGSAAEACRALLDAANAKGTPDNLTIAVFRQTGEVPRSVQTGFRQRLKNLLG
jgi:serine/threonine protein phosphatase PrpC